ncbi:MAG: divergent polysaccharide deacetylase family protein [Chitinispirillales bacterium]|jgi:polysaccharide deacetylase 2 family uncharacterized protein YibQ|nr:divergent polysaccharide deacetylase family protein [Chitinispirillales bacterium]
MSGKKKNIPPKSPPKKKFSIWTLLIITVIFGAAGLFIYPAARGIALSLFTNINHGLTASKNQPQRPSSKPITADGAAKLQNNLSKKFAGLEMRESDYSTQFYHQDSVLEIKAALPRGRPMEWLIWNLASAASSTPYSVEDGVCATENNCAVTFRSADPKYPKVNLKLQRSGRYFSNTAKMAILIENFGFEATQTAVEYLSFPEPLTMSLVPAQKLAPWTAKIADEYKKEIVMLLPMEPLPAQFGKYKQSTIMIHYTEENIRGLISQAAAAIPNFSGISNFYGNRALEDSRVMEIVLSEVNRRKAYFVYTESNRKSVAPSIAQKLKVPGGPIQGSIEASDSPEQIREKLRRYSVVAEKTGKILIKAPPSPAFIQALKGELETLRHNGIRLVYVSELVR